MLEGWLIYIVFKCFTHTRAHTHTRYTKRTLSCSRSWVEETADSSSPTPLQSPSLSSSLNSVLPPLAGAISSKHIFLTAPLDSPFTLISGGSSGFYLFLSCSFFLFHANLGFISTGHPDGDISTFKVASRRHVSLPSYQNCTGAAPELGWSKLCPRPQRHPPWPPPPPPP